MNYRSLHQRRYWGVFILVLFLTVLGSFSLRAPYAFRIFSAALLIPDLIAIPLLYRVVLEYDKGSRMRLVWVLMMWAAGFSLMRHLIDFISSYGEPGPSTVLGNLSLIPMVLSISAQLLSMTLLWFGFRGLGIRRPFTWPNRMVFVIIAVFVVFCLNESSSFPHFTAPLLFFRYIEFLNPVIFAAGTIVGVLLYRLSEDIGASDLSLSILFLVLELVARIAGFATQTLDDRFQTLFLEHFEYAFYWAAPWLFLWAVLFRWQVIGSAMRLTQLRDEQRRQNVT
jgi:hypothetical protein